MKGVVGVGLAPGRGAGVVEDVVTPGGIAGEVVVVLQVHDFSRPGLEVMHARDASEGVVAVEVRAARKAQFQVVGVQLEEIDVEALVGVLPQDRRVVRVLDLIHPVQSIIVVV